MGYAMEPRKKVINIAKGIEVEQYRNRKKGTVVHIGKDVGKEVKCTCQQKLDTKIIRLDAKK